ncbi:hypothetical protein GCM10028812_52590 [Ancylobacter sonchi]|nr:transcriptional regulator [Ancylobacter sonchi]
MAKASGVSEVTIRNFEGEKSTPQHATLIVLRQALEAAGIQFLDSGDVAVGNGVVLRG